jgi:hypothetical protein
MNELLLFVLSGWTICAAAGYLIGKIIWETGKAIVKYIRRKI